MARVTVCVTARLYAIEPDFYCAPNGALKLLASSFMYLLFYSIFIPNIYIYFFPSSLHTRYNILHIKSSEYVKPVYSPF